MSINNSVTINSTTLFDQLEELASAYNSLIPFIDFHAGTDPVEVEKTEGARDAIESASKNGFASVAGYMASIEESIDAVKKAANAAYVKEHVCGKSPSELFANPLIDQVSVKGGEGAAFTVKSTVKAVGIKRLVRLYNDLRPVGTHALPDVSRQLKALQLSFEGLVNKALVDGTIPSKGKLKERVDELLSELQIMDAHFRSKDVERMRHVMLKVVNTTIEGHKFASESAFDVLLGKTIACTIKNVDYTTQSGVKAK